MIKLSIFEDVTGLDVFKTCVGWFIGAGVTKIVSAVVEDHIDDDDYNAAQRGMIYTGKIGLAMLVKDAVQDKVNERIDYYIALYKEVQGQLDELEQERIRSNSLNN